jgi:hypothetical protein
MAIALSCEAFNFLALGREGEFLRKFEAKEVKF